MRGSRAATFAALIITALLLQVTVLDRLPLPGGQPDLLLVVVVACALAAGPLGGMVTGFLAGLLADLAPPADHTLGRIALAFAVIGYAAGLLEDVEERSVLTPVVVVALATVAASGVYAVVGALVGDARVTWEAVARGLPTAVLYDVVLTPFVVPFVSRLDRRFDRGAPTMTRGRTRPPSLEHQR